MNALRLSAAAVALTSLFAAAAALGSCSTGPDIVISVCNIPIKDEKAADGGPDPCHCAPPPSANRTTCACLTGTQEDVAAYDACMALYALEKDAGGPIPGCTGQCWPAPPDYWTSPQLLWFGAQSSAPPCPAVAPVVIFNGYAGNLFALACTSTASGSCPGLADVCGPGYADGFSQCVLREGNVDCPQFGPYIEKHVFYETAGQPSVPSTFCCLASPITQ